MNKRTVNLIEIRQNSYTITLRRSFLEVGILGIPENHMQLSWKGDIVDTILTAKCIIIAPVKM